MKNSAIVLWSLMAVALAIPLGRFTHSLLLEHHTAENGLNGHP